MKKNKKKHTLLIDTVRAYGKGLNSAGKLDDLEPVYVSRNKLAYKVDNLIFNVYTHPDGAIKYINFYGSIPKFIQGNNIEPITVKDLRKFIRKVRTKTGIDISDFLITRLDISTWVGVEHPVEYYLKLMDTYSRYKRIRNSKTSIAFQTLTGSKSLKLYDKHAELIKRNQLKTHNTYKQVKNMLRVEYMNNSAIQDDFGSRITIRDLLKPETYDLFKPILINRFKKIKFLNTLNLEQVKDKTQVIDYLIMSGVENIGGLEELNKKLKTLTLTNGFPKEEVNKVKYVINKAQSNKATITEARERSYLLKLLKKVQASHGAIRSKMSNQQLTTSKY